jgi:hypothetical protein
MDKKPSDIYQNTTIQLISEESQPLSIRRSKTQSTKLFKNSRVPQEIVCELQQVLNADISHDGLSTGNLLFLVANLMQTVGKYKKISGSDKKQIVVILINDAIETQIEDKNLEDFLQMMVTNIVPGAIDLLIDVSKKKYNFKIISKMFSKCCS